MSAVNQVVLIGRAGNNPGEDLKNLQSGSKVTELRLAVNRPGKDAMGNPVTDWLQIQAWEKNAERLAEFVHKGDLISVSGSLRTDSWEKNGEKRSKVFIHMENFQMLESRSAREQRQGSEGGSSYGGSTKADPAPADDGDGDSDELPPF